MSLPADHAREANRMFVEAEKAERELVRILRSGDCEKAIVAAFHWTSLMVGGITHTREVSPRVALERSTALRQRSTLYLSTLADLCRGRVLPAPERP